MSSSEDVKNKVAAARKAQQPRADPRQNWSHQIENEISAQGLPNMPDKYGDMLTDSNATLADGLD